MYYTIKINAARCILSFAVFSLVLSTYLCITCIPMYLFTYVPIMHDSSLYWLLNGMLFFLSYYLRTYSTCLPKYLNAYIPIMNDLLLYWLLNYLRRSSNLLTYLLTYVHTYVITYVPTYLCTYVPTDLFMYLHTYVPMYLNYLHTFFGIIDIPMYSTFLPTYLHAYIPIMYNSLLYWLLNYLGRSSNLLTYLITYIQTYT